MRGAGRGVAALGPEPPGRPTCPASRLLTGRSRGVVRWVRSGPGSLLLRLRASAAVTLGLWLNRRKDLGRTRAVSPTSRTTSRTWSRTRTVGVARLRPPTHRAGDRLYVEPLSESHASPVKGSPRPRPPRRLVVPDPGGAACRESNLRDSVRKTSDVDLRKELLTSGGIYLRSRGETIEVPIIELARS